MVKQAITWKSSKYSKIDILKIQIFGSAILQDKDSNSWASIQD